MDSVDRILVNPPLGRQVSAQGTLRGRKSRLWTELRRVLRPGGRLVALIPDSDYVDLSAYGFKVGAAYPVRLSGAGATIVYLR